MLAAPHHGVRIPVFGPDCAVAAVSVGAPAAASRAALQHDRPRSDDVPMVRPLHTLQHTVDALRPSLDYHNFLGWRAIARLLLLLLQLLLL